MVRGERGDIHGGIGDGSSGDDSGIDSDDAQWRERQYV